MMDGRCKDCRHWERTRPGYQGRTDTADGWAAKGWGWCTAIYVQGSTDLDLPDDEYERVDDARRAAAKFGLFRGDAAFVEFCTAPDFGCVMFAGKERGDE